jgi:hypothetical protein
MSEAAAPTHAALRAEIVAACRRTNEIGDNRGMSGEIGVGAGDDRFLVAPTGIPYATTTPRADCEAAWGLNADRRHSQLIGFGLAGSNLGFIHINLPVFLEKGSRRGVL